MKKFIVSLVLIFTLLQSRADEGMWLPYLLGEKVYADMVKKGLKLTKEQLYSINKSSIKDAIIIFGGGCTGEIVSKQGLIFTNHHCGYDAIASASTVDHNYLKDGFWAKSFDEEIPTKLSVQFLVRVEDVTSQIVEAVKGLSGKERNDKVQQLYNEITKKATEGTDYEARISALFKGNQYLMFVYQRYKDIRFVGTPPESIGKFGGDTDNWEWPRHTGDFSVFRVYMSKDGKPAEYSKDNIPLKPKYSLPVSIKGVKDGDFTMIFGYPGSTNRYETSYGVKLKTDVENPAIVNLRDVRLKFMFDEMKKDPAVKLQLASSYAGIANYWKFFDGEKKQLLKYDVYGQKKKDEAAFLAWAKGKSEYENIFSDWEKAYADWSPYAKHRLYLNEGILGSPLAAFASSLMQLENALVKQGSTEADVKKALGAAKTARAAFIENENKPSDMNIMAATCMMFYKDIDPDQQPTQFYTGLKAQFGDLKDENTYKTWARSVFANTMLLDDARWNDFCAKPDATVLQSDPAFAYASAFVKNWTGKYLPIYQNFTYKNNDLGRLYLKGILEMNKGKDMYPDATFTMRLSYGKVKNYRPRDAVFYDNVCTLKGVIEKYVPGDYEFDLPQSLINAYKAKNFGQYADPVKKDVVVSFITTNDITGGNSGSPVMNGQGQLVGLAFDGNYEALSHKIAFDKDLNRTICVDVRYVLWCIDVLGGAKNIINELQIVK
jgi:hypothetical protein